MKIIVHEANGLQVGQRREDGYINLTKMAQANGKKLNDYLRLETTKAFLDELSTVTGIPVTAKNGLIQVRQGGNNKAAQGSWGHPQVAINCGQWCSAKFAVLVSQWVFDWLTTAQTPIQSVQASPESLAIVKAYTESAQALNRVIHTAIHQQTNALRNALNALHSQDINGGEKSLPLEHSGTKAVADPIKRRRKGTGSGYIYWRVSQGKYKQAFYHYEIWQEGDRLLKKTKYIPKRLLSEVQQLDQHKAPVRDILRVLGVI